MELSKVSKKISDFTINRIIEIIGLILVVFSIFLFLSLATYSPEDPNFIFTEQVNIKNIFGFYGSVISDLFLQSIGLISFLFCFTIIFLGIFTIKKKKLKKILTSFFYSIIYIIFGCAFLSHFYEQSFWLIINGNGGFVGNYFKNLLLTPQYFKNENIIYFILIFFTSRFDFTAVAAATPAPCPFTLQHDIFLVAA